MSDPTTLDGFLAEVEEVAIVLNDLIVAHRLLREMLGFSNHLPGTALSRADAALSRLRQYRREQGHG